MKRINLLYLVRVWDYGGSHSIMKLLMKYLPQDRFNIRCVPFETRSRGEDELIRNFEREGLEVAKERVPWLSRANLFRARRKIAELIETNEIDLLHTHCPQSNVICGIGRKRWRCATVASPYGWWDRPSLRVTAYHWIERNLALPNFDRVITVSQNMKSKILRGRTREERIRVIHTGLDLCSLRTGTPREEVRRKLDIPQDAVVMGIVSRVAYEKGHTYLLQVLEQLKDRYPGLWVMIVGDGPMRPDLELETQRRGIKHRVVFTGFYDDLAGALAAMDIFCQPSILDEGFPTSVLEAQASGLPVVCSDTGGTKETMDVGETGLLVPKEDAGALTRAIETLVSRTDKTREMGRKAKAFIQQSFTLENMVGQVASTYEEALREYRRHR